MLANKMQIFQLFRILSVMHKAISNGDSSTATDIRMNPRTGRTESFMANLNNNADKHQHSFKPTAIKVSSEL